jgi:hypothetical protein
MTPEEHVRLRLLSDNELMAEAVQFAGGINLPPAQINGLLSFSLGEWSELERFVTHQAERNWPEVPGGEHPTRSFYKEMKRKLAWLREQSVKCGFVPGGLTKQETRDRTSQVAILLAREFIQHLSAELLFQKGAR